MCIVASPSWRPESRSTFPSAAPGGPGRGHENPPGAGRSQVAKLVQNAQGSITARVQGRPWRVAGTLWLSGQVRDVATFMEDLGKLTVTSR
jgi:hypothetical protein